MLVGTALGCCEGPVLGWFEGWLVGIDVGDVGCEDGWSEGCTLGTDVGIPKG